MTEKNNVTYDSEFWDEFFDGYERVYSEFLTPKERPEKKDCQTVLISYHLLLENAVFWSSRNEYRLLVRDFVNKKIDGSEFERSFMRLRSANMRKVRQLIETIENSDLSDQNKIPDFCYSSESVNFSRTIGNLFDAVEHYNYGASNYDSPGVTEGLRFYLGKEFLPILERLTINLDQVIDRSYNILYATTLAAIGFGLVNLNLQ